MLTPMNECLCHGMLPFFETAPHREEPTQWRLERAAPSG
jgi:hypothetical protein